MKHTTQQLYGISPQELSTDRTALPEIQHLARLIYAALPTDIQSLVSHCVKDTQ